MRYTKRDLARVLESDFPGERMFAQSTTKGGLAIARYVTTKGPDGAIKSTWVNVHLSVDEGADLDELSNRVRAALPSLRARSEEVAVRHRREHARRIAKMRQGGA